MITPIFNCRCVDNIITSNNINNDKLIYPISCNISMEFIDPTFRGCFHFATPSFMTEITEYILIFTVLQEITNPILDIMRDIVEITESYTLSKIINSVKSESTRIQYRKTWW